MDRGRGNGADWEAEGKAVGETMRSQTGGPVSERAEGGQHLIFSLSENKQTS